MSKDTDKNSEILTTPPDTICAVGRNDTIVIINSSIIFYEKEINKKTAQYFLSRTNLSKKRSFFDTDNFIADSWILYDTHVNRFVIIAIDGSLGNLYFAISKDSTFCDYLSDWHKYTIRFNPILGDFPDCPKLGFDDKAYYITSNFFKGETFNGSNIFAFTKKEVLIGSPIHVVINKLFPPSIINIQPMKVYDSNTPMYFIASDSFNNPTNIVHFIIINNFKITNTIPFTVKKYGQAPDSQFMSGCVRNGHLWSSHSIIEKGCALSKTRWYDFIISNNNNITLNQYETIKGDIDDTITMSHLDVDKRDNMAIGFSISKARDPNGVRIGFTGRKHNDVLSTTHPITIIKKIKGMCDSVSSRGQCRSGNFTCLNFDLCKNNQFWLFNEYGCGIRISKAFSNDQNVSSLAINDQSKKIEELSQYKAVANIDIKSDIKNIAHIKPSMK